MSTTFSRKNHLFGVLVKILQLKKQIRYKRQIRDTLHVYTKRDILQKNREQIKKYIDFEQIRKGVLIFFDVGPTKKIIQ